LQHEYECLFNISSLLLCKGKKEFSINMVDMDKYELLEQLQLGGSVEGASNPQENLKQEHQLLQRESKRTE